jgi:iron complex outermembrane receptor protein
MHPGISPRHSLTPGGILTLGKIQRWLLSTSHCLQRHLKQIMPGLLAGLFTVLNLHAANLSAALPDDLMDMSLEALMNIEVTSVSKKPQKQSEAAAAIFVITNDDLHRWGVTNIPDALRRVPGIEVARIDANQWAITSRGFNSRFANKLLVLIDGRSVYTPLFAGVYWDSQDVVLEDVDRIEVIRGPGGSLWGANAVNGVINIITKSAADTQGTLVSVSAGDEIRGSGTVRHGGKLNNGGNYRIYAKYSSTDEGGVSKDLDPGFGFTDTHDDWESGKVGFRTDWEDGSRDSYTLQGDLSSGQTGQLTLVPTTFAGMTVPGTVVDDTDSDTGNLLFRWTRQLQESSDFTLQVYLDHVSRNGLVLDEERTTFDIDFQHHFVPRDKHDLLWGMDFRYITDDSDSNPTFSLDPDDREVSLFSAFVQDEIDLRDDLQLTVGSKFEHNDFTGFEVQPNVRLAWSMENNKTLWGAISRAVRTPARGEHDVKLRIFPLVDPGVPVIATGDDDFDSEELLAYELGFRMHRSMWSMDVTGFYYDYDDLRTLDPDFSMFGATLPIPFGNDMDGTVSGIELAGQWQVRPNWRINGNYSYLTMDLDLKSGSVDQPSLSAEDASPTSSASVWSSYDVTSQVTVDAAVRYVDEVEVFGFMPIDSYVELDLRVGWKPRPGLELSLVGQNLLDDQHPEFAPDFIQTQATEVERSIYGKVTWNF